MRPATQEEIALFTLMGQALLNIQVLEECLSMSITLKIDVGYPYRIPKVEADRLLKKRRMLTMGQAVQEVAKNNLYADNIQEDLKKFLTERNWLVHKSIDDIYRPSDRKELFIRLRFIGIEAHRIQRAIEDDLIVFSESMGLDMSHVRAAIKQWYHVSE